MKSRIKKILSGLKKSDATAGNQQYNHNNIQTADVYPETLAGRYITILKSSQISIDTRIGSYTYIGCNTHISKTNIGRYNSIANNVNIGHGEHPLNLISTSVLVSGVGYETLTKADCTIAH